MTKNNQILKQLFSIPLGKDKYLIYAPLKRTAFIANPALVNAIIDRCQHSEALTFLEQINFFEPEQPPQDEYDLLIEVIKTSNSNCLVFFFKSEPKWTKKNL